MAQAKKHILPFFIPHQGCPQQCIFCDQHKIAGQKAPTASEIACAIAALPPEKCREYELAFYGGSFTALPADLQVYYLEPARQAMAAGRLGGVRVSTRPDCINAQVIDLLRRYGVNTVELGVQSTQDDVLRRARRGHTAAQAFSALQQLQAAGFCTGVQLMPGLPGESENFAAGWAGAKRLLNARPDMLRVYPTVVLYDTALARLYQQGAYLPLSLAEAAKITLALKLLAEQLGVAVIRMGLQPSADLAKQVLAGPYHAAFGDLVRSLYFRHKILWALRQWPAAQVIYLSKRDMAAAVGHKRQNLPFYAEIAPKLALKLWKPVDGAAELPEGAMLLKIAPAGGPELLMTDADFRRSWPSIEAEFLPEFFC